MVVLVGAVFVCCNVFDDDDDDDVFIVSRSVCLQKMVICESVCTLFFVLYGLHHLPT